MLRPLARPLAALFAVLMFALAFAGAARAQSADEAAVLAVLDRWSATYGSATSASEMVALYHPDAVFWGTGARTPFVGAADFAPYFQTQFDTFTNRMVTFVDPVVHVIGDSAVAIGLYRFNVTPPGAPAMEVLYRFSFAFVRDGDGWLITHQHSSMLPG